MNMIDHFLYDFRTFTPFKEKSFYPQKRRFSSRVALWETLNGLSASDKAGRQSRRKQHRGLRTKL